MHRVKKVSSIGSALVAFYAIGGMMNSHQTTARADNGPAVTIGGPLPLPVSGAVSAQQSGAWNVGISGTPSVNLAAGSTVNVANPQGAPLYALNLGEPGRSAYQQTKVCDNQCVVNFTVPAGHRLVIEHVAGNVHYVATPTVAWVDVVGIPLTPASIASSFFVPAQGTFTTFDQTVRVYIDGAPAGGPTRQFPVAITARGAAFPMIDTTYNNLLMVSGYLVDCTTAPCAAIPN